MPIDQPKHFAFVLMPFDPEFDDVYRIGIKETALQLDIRAERVDEQIYREGILERIYRQIDAADIIIADMTGKNPNVFYEVGYAHAKGKLCILLTSNVDDIPFDLKHRRHIVYGESITTLRQELLKDLAWAQSELEKQRISHIKVTPQNFSGTLTKTKYVARGEVTFKIDFENTSRERATDIQSLYFYSSKAWTVYQDDQECASTASDRPDGGLLKRHFLRPPLAQLQKGAWAQVKFNASRLLGTAFNGEELKDSYRIQGRSLLRLVTSDGNFDYEIPVDVTVDEIPF